MNGMMLYFSLALGTIMIVSFAIALVQLVRPSRKPEPETNLSGRPIVVPPLPPIRKVPEKLELDE